MRNLKKVLSLALAMVMLLGMMVVGAGAATSFKDDSDIPENREVAVAVANAIEVLLGDENGNFNPSNTLTRAEAAVVLTKLDLGAEAAKALVPTDAASFDDVGVGYGWAKAYIDYCAGNEYMIGVGGNRFAPAQTLTSVEFGLMVSRVLGYRDANEGITGDAWMVKAAAVARKAGLGTDLAVGNSPMTRADMAQMVLNALTAPMVEYTGLNINTDQINVNSPASVRRHSANNSNVNTTYDGERIQSNITPIRLCEEKFPNLKLSRQDELDKFGRRCSVWLYKGLKIAGSEGTIVPDLAYNTKVTKDTVAEWAKMEDLYAADGMQLWINGKKMPVAPVVPDSTKPNETYAPGTDDWIGWYTGAGREVEVYLNKDNLREVERVVVVDTVLAEVTKLNPDETISVKLTDSNASERNVVLSTVIGYGEFKKGDMVLVQGYSTASDKLNAKTTVSSVIEAPVVVGFATVKGYDNQTDAAYITVEGTQYKDAYSVVKDFAVDNFELNTKFDSTLYLDTHGNIMKAIMGEDPNAVSDKLIAVKRVYSALKDGEIVNMIEGVISNGNTVNWPVDDNYKAYENGLALWVKGTGRDSDKYKLTPVVDKDTIVTVDGKKVDSHVANVYAKDATLEFKSNDVYGKGYANTYMYSDTVKFIFVDKEEGVTVVNGRQNHTFKADEDDTKVAYAVNQKGEIIAVFVTDQADVANISDIIYVHSRYREWDEVITRENGTRVQYYGYTAYTSDGVEIDHFLGEANDMANQFFVANKNSDGAYKKNNYSVIGKHTFVNGVVNTANGMTGDAFLLYEFGNTDATKDTATGTVFEFLGRSGAKVVDLTDSKLYIESISEINDAVNAGRKITLAVIYNSTTAPVVKGSADTETVKDPQTIFVIGVGAVGSLDDVDFTTPGVPTAGKLTIVDADKGLESSTPASGADVKKDDVITVTVKDGFEATAEGATQTNVTDNVYTFKADSDEGVTITITKKTTVDTFKLTLSSDDIIGTGHSVIYSTDGGKNWVKAPDPETKLSPSGDVLVYSIPENAEVAVNTKTAVAANGSYNVDGVVAVGKTNPKQLTFKMSKDITISALPTAKLIALHEGTGVELLKVTKSNGTDEIAVTEIDGVKYISAADAQKLTVKSANADAVIAVANETDIHVASSGKNATGTKAAGGAVLDNGAAIAADLWLYEASAVNFNDTGVSAKVGDTPLTNGDYVVTGETVVAAVSTPATNGTGVISQTATKTNVVGVDEKAGILVGNEDITLKAAFKVTLGEGVTATVGAEEVHTNDYVVKGTSTLALATADAANKVVVNTTSGNTHGVAITSNETVSADVEYSAMTKVVLEVEASATISIRTEDELGVPSTAVIYTQAAAAAETYGFAEDTVILVSGATAQAKSITCTSTDAVTGSNHTGSTTAGDVPTLIVTVKSASVTLGLST